MQAESPPTSWQVAESVLLDPLEQSKLLAYARERFGIGADDARDLVQETALELLRQQSVVESPRGFIFAVFRSRCCRFLDACRRTREVFVAPPAEQIEPREECPAPSADSEQQFALREALQVISSSCRRLLAAYYVEGKTLVETARRLEMATTGVSKTFNRCLQRLRRCLS
jgi:RNA polymerase sigma factor (sigma-70 family)